VACDRNTCQRHWAISRELCPNFANRKSTRYVYLALAVLEVRDQISFGFLLEQSRLALTISISINEVISNMAVKTGKRELIDTGTDKRYVAPIQKTSWSRKSFEYGTWGGKIRSEFEPTLHDVVVQEHWCSSGFANTDLDLQLKKYGIHKLIIIGLIAHTCVEATVRFAAEFGYEVTVVKDATADYSDKEMDAALEVNIPNYANAVVTTNEIVESISR
jgi:nicotinamidase-related amidase